MKNKFIFGLVFILISCSASYIFSEVTIKGGDLPPFDKNSLKDPAIGAFAPIPTGIGLEGNSVTISTRKNTEQKKATMVVFLAHWCSHCQREVPMIQKWINENGYPENINIYAVATHIDKTMPNYPPNEWLSREEWSVPVIFDDKNNSVAESFGLTAFPFWVFINEDGTVNLRHSGSLRSEAFERIITSGIQ